MPFKSYSLRTGTLHRKNVKYMGGTKKMEGDQRVGRVAMNGTLHPNNGKKKTHKVRAVHSTEKTVKKK